MDGDACKPQARSQAPPGDAAGSILPDALSKIADLLAMAYQRHAAVLQVGTDQKPVAADCGLANAGGSSVHGDVP